MKSPIGLFEAYGIEIELMIVDQTSLDVRPWADKLLTDAQGELVSDFEDGPITWSNELVSHVIEFKTTAPAASLDDLESKFFESQRHAAKLLAARGARLMPTGMHPWMNPLTETVIWPHDNNEIYGLYNKIFDCRGHGWSNLQSVHINLPFKNEPEFTRLHSAIRAILPIIPALSASTPLSDGRYTTSIPTATGVTTTSSTSSATAHTASSNGSPAANSINGSATAHSASPNPIKDTRLAYYEANQKKLPIIAGDVIPVSIQSYDDYRAKITNPIQVAIKPYDSDGLLEGDWLNSRGAIARIDRGTIEIRLIDTQECAHADLAIVQLVVSVIHSLVESSDFLSRADTLETRHLHAIYSACVRDAESAPINDTAYLSLFGYPRIAKAIPTAQDLWKHLAETRLHSSLDTTARKAIKDLLARPSLATRITKAAGPNPTHERLHTIYAKLCDCLDKNQIFQADL